MFYLSCIHGTLIISLKLSTQSNVPSTKILKTHTHTYMDHFNFCNLHLKFSTIDPALWMGLVWLTFHACMLIHCYTNFGFSSYIAKIYYRKLPICTSFHGGLLFPSTNTKYLLNKCHELQELSLKHNLCFWRSDHYIQTAWDYTNMPVFQSMFKCTLFICHTSYVYFNFLVNWQKSFKVRHSIALHDTGSVILIR